MGTPKQIRPKWSQASAELKPSHLRMLRCARTSPLMKPDPLDPQSYIPKGELPIKGAVASTLIRSLQHRGLVDLYGVITVAGRELLSAETVANQGEC